MGLFGNMPIKHIVRRCTLKSTKVERTTKQNTESRGKKLWQKKPKW